MPFDLLLQGAFVVDGTGSPGQRHDVGVERDRIAYVGPPLPVDVEARVVLDLTGQVLTPGFIDIHTHSDVSLLHDPRGESKALQGVTTEVVGNCGFSAFPVDRRRSAALLDHLARLGDAEPELTWTDFNGFAQAMQQARPLLNVGALVGHGALRIAAMDDAFGRASSADADRMGRLLESALEQGAFGMSTGLTHTPSSLGTAQEIEQLAAICARSDAMYATHARATAGAEFEAIREAIRASRNSGARLQYSHLAINEPAAWGRAADALALFDAARAAGLDVAFDVYPYDASSSALIQYIPEWAQAGGGDGVRKNNSDPDWRARALADIPSGWFGGIPWHWDRITISAAGPHTDEVGLTIEQIARRRGTSPAEVLLDLCAELGGAAQAVLHYRTEEDMVAFLQHELAVVGSDGIAVALDGGDDLPHPRGFGTFPRVLGRYVRDRGVLLLPDAVRRMTLAPAHRLGLADRGVIRHGAKADLVAFSPQEVADTATFLAPRQAPVGITHSVVNGQVVVAGGRLTGSRGGEVIRHG